MLTGRLRKDIEFLKTFHEKTKEYVNTFHEMEAIDERPERSSTRLTEKQIDDLSERWFNQRQELVKMYDHAHSISNKYNVPDEYYTLIHRKPGDANEWGGKLTIHPSDLISLNDSIIRTITALEHPPACHIRVGKHLQTALKWLDNKGLAKAFVVAFLFFLLALILRMLGFDRKGIVEIIKLFIKP
jgi:hypothetical protein